MHSRKKGRAGEEIARSWYEDRGWECIDVNYTIRGGEIDLILENVHERVYVEVKSIDRIDDVHGFVTKVKLQRVRRTMQFHIRRFPTKKHVRIDVVFVKYGKVAHVFPYIGF